MMLIPGRMSQTQHDPIGADAISAVQYDPCAPNMLLGDVAVPDERLQTTTVGRAKMMLIPGRMSQTRTQKSGGNPTRDSCQILSTRGRLCA